MTLQQISGDNKWCGPGVISAIAGITTDEAEKLLQNEAGINRAITLVQMDWVKEVFTKLGYQMVPVRAQGSLYFTLTMLSMKPNAVYILVVPHHVVAIEVIDKRIYFVDNHTKSPMNAASSARMMQRVTHIWRVSKI